MISPLSEEPRYVIDDSYPLNFDFEMAPIRPFNFDFEIASGACDQQSQSFRYGTQDFYPFH